jgi:hypothetical protein
MSAKRSIGVVFLGLVAATAGCADGDGVVLDVHPQGGFDPSRVTQLELFLAGPKIEDGTGMPRRIRNVSDPNATIDLFYLDGAALDGFRIYLHGSLADIDIVALAAYVDPPVDETDYPVAVGAVKPMPIAGDVVEHDIDLYPTGVPGQPVAPDEWAVRHDGADVAIPTGVVAHSCLAWGHDQDGIVDSIVREGDLDCDGTLPGSCDPDQMSPGIDDDTPNTDLDGDGAWTCCRTETGDPRPCDCRDDQMHNYYGNAEICDGLDNDCSGAPDFITTDIAEANPCSLGAPTNCEIGLMICDEANDQNAEQCREVLSTELGTCAMSIDPQTCQRPDVCMISTGGGDLAELFQCTIELDTAGVPCNATVSVGALALMPDVGAALSGSCDAAVWNYAPVGGGTVKLRDVTTGDTDVTLLDRECEALGLVVEAAGDGPQSIVVSIYERAEDKWVTLPIHIDRDANVATCTAQSFSCTAPTL